MNTLMGFDQICRDEVLMAPHMCLGFSARSAKGWGQGGAN